MVHGYYFDALDSMLARIPAEIRGEITLYVSTPMGQLHRVAGLLPRLAKRCAVRGGEQRS